MGSNPTSSGFLLDGEVSEWLKEHAWKACVRETVPRVRIPPSPPPKEDVQTPKYCLARLSFQFLFPQNETINNTFGLALPGEKLLK